MASETLDMLRKELVVKRAVADQSAREARALEQAIAVLSGDVLVIGDSAPTSQDFRGLGIVDAAKRFIQEAGAPQSTGDIARELARRGLESNSKKWVSTVYSTLDNSPDLKRIGKGREGRWLIKEKRG